MANGCAGPARARVGLERRPVLRADRLDAEIDQLDILLALVVEAEGAVVDLVEILPHVGDRGLAVELGRNVDLDLVALAEIAHVGDAVDARSVLGGCPRRSMSATPVACERVPGGEDLVGVGRRLPAHHGADIVAADVGDVEAEGAEIAGVGRRDDRA